MSRTRTVDESRWNVARRLASLLHGAILSNGVPVLEWLVEEARWIDADVELVNEPSPT